MTAIPKTKYEIIVGKDNKRYMKVPVEDIKGALPGPIQMDEQGRQFVLMPVIEQQAPQPAPKKKRPLILSLLIYGVVGCLVLSVIGAIVNRNNPSAPASAPAASAAKPAVTLNAPVAVKAEPTAVPPTEAPAPTQAPPTEVPKPQLAKVGDRVEAGGIALTIVGVSRAASINDIFNPKDGNEFLVIEAIIENVSRDDETPYNPLYFKVKNSDGFQADGSLLAPDPDMKSGKLMKGDKARGNVAFEVKKGTTGWVVIYEPLVILGGYEPIRVSLE